MNLSENYREILRSELSLRFRKNPRYSLRAFARHLKIDPARLSEVLNQKSGISLHTAIQFCKQLDFSKEQTEYFCDLVEAQHARSKVAKAEALARLASRKENSIFTNPTLRGRNLTFDSFRLVEDWYHLAILQYLKLDQAKSNIPEIARYFAISEHETRDAIERMLRLELIELKNGRWKPVDDWVMSPASIPSSSIRKFHEQILERASQSLNLETLARRSMRSIVFPVDLAHLPAIEAKMKTFAEDLVAEYSAPGPSSEVSAISLQFFPLSQPSSETEHA